MKSSALPLLIIVGAGGLGSELLGCVLSDPASDNEWCLAGFLDDRTEKDDQISGWSKAFNRPIVRYGSLAELGSLEGKYFLIAIKDPLLKQKYVEKIMDNGGYVIPLLHGGKERNPSASVGQSILISNCILGANSEIKNFVWLDRNVIVGHNCLIEDYCHISSNVFIGGNTVIGEKTIIYAGSLISDGINIGANCIIGIGSVVARDIPDGSVVLGNPAKRVGNV